MIPKLNKKYFIVFKGVDVWDGYIGEAECIDNTPEPWEDLVIYLFKLPDGQTASFSEQDIIKEIE